MSKNIFKNLMNFDKPGQLVLDDEGFYHNKGGVKEEPVTGKILQETVEALKLLGNFHSQKGDPVAARHAYEKARELDPEHPRGSNH